MEKGNYDPVASWYDRLSRLVFFKAQVNAQTDQLRFLQNYQRILIVGGGTGWILEELASRNNNLEITYVEISINMLKLAMKRNTGSNTVTFLNFAIENFNDSTPYDAILTAFLFDNFGEDKAKSVFYGLHNKLKNGGLWLFADFSDNHLHTKWQSVLLKIMYFFFKRSANIEAKYLISMYPFFNKENYKYLLERYYYFSFIKATVFKKL